MSAKRLKTHQTSIALLPVLATLLMAAQPMSGQPTITTCASGFFGKDVVISNLAPHDAFIASFSVVKHFSGVVPGSGECSFGTALPDIPLGAGMSDSWGVALDNFGNLFVGAGSSEASLTAILEIEPPYTGPPTVFYSAGTNFRSLAIHGSILYAADPGAGAILRFDLGVGPSSVRTFATVPGVFGIVAAGADDLFVTSNAGAGGTNDVKHVARTRVGVGIRTVATGLSDPEGIGSGGGNLYIAAAGVVFTVPTSGGTPTFYAGSPIEFSHGVTVWKGGGYVTDSHSPGEVHKFTLL